LFYQFVDYDSAIAIIYEGGYGTEYLPSETRDDCLCAADVHFLFTWPTDADGWVHGQLVWIWDVRQFITGTPDATGQWKYQVVWNWDQLSARFGFDLPVVFDQVRFKFYNNPDVGEPIRHLIQISVYGVSPTGYTSETYDTDDFAHSEWHQIIWNLPEPLTSGHLEGAIKVTMYRYSPVNDFQRIWFDDFGFYKKP